MAIGIPSARFSTFMIMLCVSLANLDAQTVIKLPKNKYTPIPLPSTQYRTIKGGTVFEVAIPVNWNAVASKNAIRVIPENGSGQLNGQDVFTHGVEFGVIPPGSRDLQQATIAFLRAVAQGNPGLELAGSQQTVQLSNRAAVATPLVNTSPLGGQERIALYTAFLADGSLFYYLTVAPERDVAALQETFRRVGGSIHLTDLR